MNDINNSDYYNLYEWNENNEKKMRKMIAEGKTVYQEEEREKGLWDDLVYTVFGNFTTMFRWIFGITITIIIACCCYFCCAIIVSICGKLN